MSTPLVDYLKYRAGYSPAEIETILAHPELESEAVQKELCGVLRECGSPASIRRAFETQLALHVKPIPAEAATDVEETGAESRELGEDSTNHEHDPATTG